MRKDDWITQLYIKSLNDYTKYSRNSGENVSSKKKNTSKKSKPRQV